MDGSPRWWGTHVEATVQYAKAVKAGDRQGALSAVTHLVRGVAKWGERVAGRSSAAIGTLAHGLMAEHVVGAKLVADQRPLDDARSVDTAIDLLGRNAKLQAAVLGAAVPDFPYAKFLELLVDHLGITASYISDLARGDDASFQGHVSAAMKNAMDLDRLSDEHL